MSASSAVDQWSEDSLGFDLERFIGEMQVKHDKMNITSVVDAGLKCLEAHEMEVKVFITLYAYLQYHVHKLPLFNSRGELTSIASTVHELRRPGRPDGSVQVLRARDMPKRGKGGSLQKRIAMIHSLAHIESYAIDLSWDVMLRFLDSEYWREVTHSQLQPEFIVDWLKIAADEARHFRIWVHRLHEFESFYGALPVHDGLWETAYGSKDDLLARLSVVHMVHEARGLDVAPSTLSRFAAAGDERSVELLQSIYEDEISHVAAAVKWFKLLAVSENEQVDDSLVIEQFHVFVRKYFCGRLKPPFNDDARKAAGFTEEWYLPLVEDPNLAICRTTEQHGGVEEEVE